MEWIALIGLLIQIFGPILSEFLKKWLDNHLQAAASTLPAYESYAGLRQQVEELFERAISETRRPLRRMLLRRLRQMTLNRIQDNGVLEGQPLFEDEALELRDLSAADRDDPDPD